jgi:DNA-binding CsgD family transcriptional regulator
MKIGWRGLEAYALGELATMLGSQGQYGQGVAMMQRAVALAQEIEQTEWVCVALRELGVITTLDTAQIQATPRLVWRLQVALGQLYQAQGRTTEAEQAFVAARTVIDKIAATIPDAALRDNFLRQTQALLPHSRAVTPLQAAKAAHAGLTRREREVAGLIGKGKSNRAIAETLVIGERTVEGHMGNLLGKLGFTSRAQIAVWAAENGLTKQ